MGQAGIRFSGENKLEFIIELRKKVMNYFETNNISKYGNMNIVLQTILMFSIYLVPYFLMMLGIIDSFFGVWLGWIVIGLGNAGVGMVTMHDANHQSFSKNPMVNVWMSKTLFLLGGLPETWQYQHNTLHHGFTNIDGHDEDINPGPFLRFSPHKPLYKAHRFQHFYAWFFYGLMTISWITTKDFKQLYNYKKRGVSLSSNKSHGQLLAILIISKILYYGVFMILPLIILPFAWYWIIVFFLTMHFTSGFILTIIFQTAHVMPTSQYPLPDESGTIENNWAVHQLFTTSDYAPKNKVLSWLVGGLNYQVEHHLFPDISHVHYHKISGIVKIMAQKYNLPYHVQSGFFKAILEHAKMLKKLGRAYSI
ncbi:MAG: acyl-CoA desaturase [Bacteroidales bacterium]|nr:acyl-CoA desaturase [Bacteroidales bacterium]